MNFTPSSEAKNKLGEHTLFSRIIAYTIEPLPDNVSLSIVLEKVEELVPKVFFDNVDSIYIGHFREFEENGTNAFYSDGALFISNNQTDNDDLLDDILHETAHAVEREYEAFIYDTDLEKEFLTRRKVLYNRIKTLSDSKGLDLDFNKQEFMSLEYSRDFDEFLYQTLGYAFLHNISYDLFVSPYGATSLQEYWANGFENYFADNPETVRKISPILYGKIQSIAEEV